jgi:transporter family-2 protein
MSPQLFLPLALFAGAAIAAQAAANARLGVLLESTSTATGYAFFAGLVATGLVALVLRSPLPGGAAVSRVPTHLWAMGGLLSALGVGAIYWLIPQMGVARAVGGALVGQLLFSLLASHFGWFGLPVSRIDAPRLGGAVLLLVGIALIQRSDA